MAKLTVNEKDALYSILQIHGGYVLSDLYKQTKKNKTFTRDIILDVTGIDIYSDENYKNLSQQKSIEKIIDEKDDRMVGKLLQEFYNFFKNNDPKCIREIICDMCEKRRKCLVVENIIQRLLYGDTTHLPELKTYQELEENLKDLLEKKQYSLAIDRLHTYSLKFFEERCSKNGLKPNLDRKGHIMFDDMIKQLTNFYKTKNLISEFAEQSLNNSKSIFQMFNKVRNNESYVHVNDIIKHSDAKFVIDSILSIVNYIGAIDKD